jgi:hypothetical protein
LSLAIQQINRDVLITKVCNDLLPTANTLCKMKYQHHDTCILCYQQYTRDILLDAQQQQESNGGDINIYVHYEKD